MAMSELELKRLMEVAKPIATLDVTKWLEEVRDRLIAVKTRLN